MQIECQLFFVISLYLVRTPCAYKCAAHVYAHSIFGGKITKKNAHAQIYLHFFVHFTDLVVKKRDFRGGKSLLRRG